MAVSLFYKEFGVSESTPLILLHGYPLDHTIWLALLPYLKKQTRVILPDLRGHGRSPVPQGVYTMQEMAEDVLALMDMLGIEKAVLGGHSMGGYVALAFARAFPERLAGFALIASHAYADSEEKRNSRLQTAQQAQETGTTTQALADMPALLSDQPQVREKMQTLIKQAHPLGVMGVLRGMAQRPESLDVLKALTIPTLIIAGVNDKFIPIETARQMAAHLPQPWLEEMSDCGHMPMLEQTHKTAGFLRQLLDQITST